MRERIYEDILKRTGGDVYVGVVGPVRTGKSTFIHKFMEEAVLPAISNEFDRERAMDQSPQSGSGRTVTTTEPKFVPDEAVRITPCDGISLNVKLIDCVGYMVNGALGSEEDGRDRMLRTPWSEEPMPFARAAELGTEKVIGEHSTIAILVTTDGSIADIPRESYVEAEERVVRELRECGKPFAIVLNSAEPDSDAARVLAEELEKKYSAPVALVSCAELNADDIREILGLVLYEFPVKEIRFRIPEWTAALPKDHRLKREIIDKISAFSDAVRCIGDVERMRDSFGFPLGEIDAGVGTAELTVPVEREEYYRVLSEAAGEDVSDEGALLGLLLRLTDVKHRYDRVEQALCDVEAKGYGIVMPEPSELKLDEPQLVRQANGYGVKMTAHADSIHMIRTAIKTELCPVVGSEEQSTEVMKFLSDEFSENPEGVWSYNMFGRSLYDMVTDGMEAKLENMPDESREKLGQTLGKIINEGSNGLICILL